MASIDQDPGESFGSGCFGERHPVLGHGQWHLRVPRTATVPSFFCVKIDESRGKSMNCLVIGEVLPSLALQKHKELLSFE